jgi:hypothetical protein
VSRDPTDAVQGVSLLTPLRYLEHDLIHQNALHHTSPVPTNHVSAQLPTYVVGNVTLAQPSLVPVPAT